MGREHRKVSKVVIPVAGLGSRFLPATKAIPKELLPIIDRPIIHYIVEEAVEAGISTVVFVISRPKVSIADYFDPADITSFRLAEAGKSHLIEDVLELSNKIEIVSVRQTEAKGLGHAVLTAAPIVGGQNFAVVLGDDVIVSPGSSAIGQCLENFQERDSGSVVGVLEVPPSETNKYGIVDVDAKNRIRHFVEKPAEGESPSNWAIPGRYVFEPEILDVLRKTPPGKNGELQLTDAMELLLQQSEFYAQPLEGQRFDTGDKLGYIMANVSFALEDPQFKKPLKTWLEKKLKEYS